MDTLRAGRIEVYQNFTSPSPGVAVELRGDKGQIVGTIRVRDSPSGNKFIVQIKSGISLEFRLEIGGEK